MNDVSWFDRWAGLGASARRRWAIRHVAFAALLAVTASTVAERAFADTPGARNALASGDCVAAGKAINEGLDRNDAEAFFLAGVLYDDSVCVQRDPVRAMRLYRRSIALGNEDAPIFLGLLIGLGRGVPQDYAAAHRAYDGDRAAAGDATATTAELTALGYAETVAQLALRKVVYPISANAKGIEANIDVSVAPTGDEVRFQDVHVGTEIGSSFPRTRDFTDAITAAYREAMAQAPRPDLTSDPTIRALTPWHFAMRRSADNRKVRLEGVVTVGETRTVH